MVVKVAPARRAAEPTVELHSPREGSQPEAEREAAPRPVRVTIDRIEVRMAAPARPAPRPRATPRSGLDLDEYLARRGRLG